MLPNVQKKLNLFVVLTAVAVAVVSLPVAARAQDVNDFNVPDFNLLEDPNLQMGPEIPGRVEGTGTYFEVTDSNYLNITLESSEVVHVMLESVPEMVVMDINSAEGATSSQITLTGFEPSTTYYKYEDDYHNEVTFATDENGSSTYTQDLSQPHLVFIQPNAGTIFIPGNTSVGTWDPVTRIYTLTIDVYESIEIDEDNLTLDGARHNVSGTGGGYGVLLSGRSGITIKNVNVQRFYTGIYLRYSSNNTLTNNTPSNNGFGIDLYRSSGNTLTGNTASNNGSGISLYRSHGSTLTGNTVTSNGGGIFLSDSSSNTLTDNTASDNRHSGIRLYNSSSNTLTNNTASNNNDGIHLNGYGIYLADGGNNTLAGNTASNNGYGIYVAWNSDNTLIDNTASDNEYGIYITSSSGSTLSGNTMTGNRHNFAAYGNSDSHFDNEIDTTNTVDGKPVYYVKNAAGTVYDSSTNAGTFYAINCDNITIKDLTLTNTYCGVFLWNTHNSSIENVTSSNTYNGIALEYSSNNILTGNKAALNDLYGIELCRSSNNILTGNTASNNAYRGIILLGSSNNNNLTGNTVSDNDNLGIVVAYSSSNTLTENTASNNSLGIYLQSSSSNTLTGNITSNNWGDGIHLQSSSSNTLTANTAWNNGYGICLRYGSTNNLIYNNNFIDNIRYQAYVYGASGNVFNLDKPIGGNYWSNWCPPSHPDNDGDGFVDEAYFFTGGVDYLPLVCPYVLNQPPVADAGDNIQILSADQAYTVIQGTASDPDGDALEYRWLKAEQVLLDWSPVGASGEAYLDLAMLSYLDVGNHTLTFEAKDAELTASDDMVLTLQNSPPDAQPAPNSQVVEIGMDPIVVVADAADFDGDTLSYEWLKNGEVLASGSVETVQGGDRVPIPDLNIAAGDTRFPLGAHQIELKVSDGINDPVSAFVSVEVIDTTAPSLGPIPSVTILWPPNHELQPVTIAANTFDNGGGMITLAVAVQSSEPPDTTGDGSTIPDYYIDSVDNVTGLIELRLRAERQGKGNGRTYTITITATDETGNRSVAIVEVLAPHDRRKK